MASYKRQGPQGLKGLKGTSMIGGRIPPTNDIGDIGDTYIDTAAAVLYGPKESVEDINFADRNFSNENTTPLDETLSANCRIEDAKLIFKNTLNTKRSTGLGIADVSYTTLPTPVTEFSTYDLKVHLDYVYNNGTGIKIQVYANTDFVQLTGTALADQISAPIILADQIVGDFGEVGELYFGIIVYTTLDGMPVQDLIKISRIEVIGKGAGWGTGTSLIPPTP